MRVYLKDKQTGLFFGADGAWTAARHEAEDFKHSERAILAAHKNQLRNTEVIFVFEGSTMDMCISIDEQEFRAGHNPGVTQAGRPAGKRQARGAALKRKGLREAPIGRESDVLESL